MLLHRINYQAGRLINHLEKIKVRFFLRKRREVGFHGCLVLCKIQEILDKILLVIAFKRVTAAEFTSTFLNTPQDIISRSAYCSQ